MISVLVVRTRGGSDLAILARAVERIVREDAWTGPEPVDLCAALGVEPAEPQRRVGVIATAEGDRAIALPGHLTVGEIARADVYALPDAFRDLPLWRAILGVTLPEKGRPLVVVAPESLARGTR